MLSRRYSSNTTLVASQPWQVVIAAFWPAALIGIKLVDTDLSGVVGDNQMLKLTKDSEIKRVSWGCLRSATENESAKHRNQRQTAEIRCKYSTKLDPFFFHSVAFRRHS